MIILGIILSVFAIAFICWLLFTLAVYALPFYAGLTSAFWAYHHGYGAFAAALIAIFAAGATLIVGQLAFALVRLPILRVTIALLFAVPAAVAGYYATLGIAHLCIGAGTLGTALAVIGAALVGVTAWARMAVYLPPSSRRDIAAEQLTSPAASAANR